MNDLQTSLYRSTAPRKAKLGAVGALATALGLGMASCDPLPAFGAVASHEIEAGKVADAIYRAEGGARAKVAYGVLSVKVRNAQEARQVCLNSVMNSRARWEKAGRPGDWLEFMAARWIPVSADPVGHRNWLRNVRAILKNHTKDVKSNGLSRWYS